MRLLETCIEVHPRTTSSISDERPSFRAAVSSGIDNHSRDAASLAAGARLRERDAIECA